jgi:hypothetical protein
MRSDQSTRFVRTPHVIVAAQAATPQEELRAGDVGDSRLLGAAGELSNDENGMNDRHGKVFR